MRRALALGVLTAASLAACGDGGTSVSSATVGVREEAASARATATMFTSPDGGIYRNPVHVDVLALTTFDPAALASRLQTQQQWEALRGLGPFTAVGLRLQNRGAAGSDPDLRYLQIASDLEPAAAVSSPAAHALYHPMFPLAAVSDVALDGCQPHLDPGQYADVVLVYPPVSAGGFVVWGEYGDFALRFGYGGGLPGLPAQLHAAACARPEPQ